MESFESSPFPVYEPSCTCSLAKKKQRPLLFYARRAREWERSVERLRSLSGNVEFIRIKVSSSECIMRCVLVVVFTDINRSPCIKTLSRTVSISSIMHTNRIWNRHTRKRSFVHRPQHERGRYQSSLARFVRISLFSFYTKLHLRDVGNKSILNSSGQCKIFF